MKLTIIIAINRFVIIVIMKKACNAGPLQKGKKYRNIELVPAHLQLIHDGSKLLVQFKNPGINASP